MQIVTFTSDFGTTDYYVGVMKGAMLSKQSDLNIVDVTHEVSGYDIVKASYIVKNTFDSFPRGTIHLVSVDNYYNSDPKFVVAFYKGHYFVGPDNGVFSLIFGEDEPAMYLLDSNQSGAFPVKDIYADAVGHIVSDLPFNEIGLTFSDMAKRITLHPVIKQDLIRASVIHIDSYGNVVLNVSKDICERAREGRQVKVLFKRTDPIVGIKNTYSDVSVGETLVMYNSADFLEIAICKGRAADLLGFNIDDSVQIHFVS